MNVKDFFKTFILTGFFIVNAMAAVASEDIRHYTVGKFDIMAITDAHTTMEKKLLPDLSGYPEFESVFANGPAAAVAQTFYFKDGTHNVLIDGGWGNSLPVKGNTVKLLREAGINPSSITDVLLTHLDGDHIGGLMENGKPVYPNATLWIAKPEYEAWIDKKNVRRPQPVISLAKQVVTAYKNKVRLFNFGEEIIPGVYSVDASGHTPGHTAYDIISGNSKMTIAGDIMHIPAVQLVRPELSTVYDNDPKLAASARKQMLERAVREKSIFAGMHFPAISTVRKMPNHGFAMQQPR